MEDAFAFRCSENETVLVADGKTMADERKRGVRKNEITNDAMAATPVTIPMIRRFFQDKNKLVLFDIRHHGTLPGILILRWRKDYYCLM